MTSRERGSDDRTLSKDAHMDCYQYGSAPVTGHKLTRETITKIVRDVAELPDRTSPDDQPDMMLVTAEELQIILARHFSNPVSGDKLTRGLNAKS
jgi:hypothetical protein